MKKEYLAVCEGKIEKQGVQKFENFLVKDGRSNTSRVNRKNSPVLFSYDFLNFFAISHSLQQSQPVHPHLLKALEMKEKKQTKNE